MIRYSMAAAARLVVFACAFALAVGSATAALPCKSGFNGQAPHTVGRALECNATKAANGLVRSMYAALYSSKLGATRSCASCPLQQVSWPLVLVPTKCIVILFVC